MSDVAALLPDPSPRLEAGFRAVHAQRMQGLDFVNAALEVEAVGFAPWEGRWLGIVVTPWCMNLTLVPRDPRAWQPLAIGAKRRYRFPAGEYDFVGARDDAVGEYQVCSLFSPVLEFADHETARLTAQHALAALMDSAHADPPPAPQSGAALAGLREAMAAPLSKRDFLRGRFSGGPGDGRG